MDSAASRPPASNPPLTRFTRRRLVLVHGKGGVGKTVLSQALALTLSRQRGAAAKVLWVEFEGPVRPPGVKTSEGPGLWHLNAEATAAFDEYAALKIGSLGFGLGTLGAFGFTKLFTHNKLIQYLAQAAPGIHELVLLGKIWHEREHYDHVVVDMPSTGYALAMFQSTKNFATLFGGGPLSRDAEKMLETFGNPAECAHVIASLPEEMPLRESIDLAAHLARLFPENPSGYVLNRRFPAVPGLSASDLGDDETAPPFARTIGEYARRRSALEAQNLRLWEQNGIRFGEIPFFPPGGELVEAIASTLRQRELV